MYLSRVQAVELLGVEVDGQPRPLPRLQDAPRLLDAEDAALAERVDVVHRQLARLHQRRHRRQLTLDDVSRRRLSRAASAKSSITIPYFFT